MTINKIEEHKPAAIPQPQWSSPPPENRWDELRAAFPPAPPVDQENFYDWFLRQLREHDELEDDPIITGVELGKQWETAKREIMDGLEAAEEYDDPSLMRNLTLSEYEGDFEAVEDEFTEASERRADPIEILEEIARGRTMPYDKCTPEEAQDAMHHIDECDVPIADRTEYARRVLNGSWWVV